RKPAAGEGMTLSEHRELNRLETVIAQNLQTFWEVGEALATIREKRLYRETHKAFEHYCKSRWGFTYRHANRLITACQVAEEEKAAGRPAPTTECAARRLRAERLGANGAARSRTADTQTDTLVTNTGGRPVSFDPAKVRQIHDLLGQVRTLHAAHPERV